MKNTEQWKASKYVLRKNTWRASEDRAQVALGSRIIADLTATQYAEYLPRYSKGDFLDLGCGDVPFYGMYAPYTTTITCVDWENSLHGQDHLDLTCDLGKTLPFHDASYDTILLSDVLEHLPEPLQLWRECFRILRPQGHLILNVPFLYWIHEAPHDYFRYTEYALRYHAQSVGLEIIHLEPLGGVPEVILDVLCKNLPWFPYFGEASAHLLEQWGLWFTRTHTGKKWSNARKHSFPLAYFMVVQKL